MQLIRKIGMILLGIFIITSSNLIFNDNADYQKASAAEQLEVVTSGHWDVWHGSDYMTYFFFQSGMFWKVDESSGTVQPERFLSYNFDWQNYEYFYAPSYGYRVNNCGWNCTGMEYTDPTTPTAQLIEPTGQSWKLRNTTFYGSYVLFQHSSRYAHSFGVKIWRKAKPPKNNPPTMNLSLTLDNHVLSEKIA